MCSICQYVFFHTALMFRKKNPGFCRDFDFFRKFCVIIKIW